MTECSASSPEDPGTPTQDLKAAVAADTSNESGEEKYHFNQSE